MPEAASSVARRHARRDPDTTARAPAARGRVVSAARAPAVATAVPALAPTMACGQAVSPARGRAASAARGPARRMAGRSSVTRKLRGGTPPGETCSPATPGPRDRPGPIPIPARGRAASAARALAATMARGRAASAARALAATMARGRAASAARALAATMARGQAVNSARGQVFLVPARSAPASASANTVPMLRRIAHSIRPRATSTSSRQRPRASRRPRRSSRPRRLRLVRRVVQTTELVRAVSRTVAHSDPASHPRPAGLDRRSLRRPPIFSVRTRSWLPAGIRWKRPSSLDVRPTACWSCRSAARRSRSWCSTPPVCASRSSRSRVGR